MTEILDIRPEDSAVHTGIRQRAGIAEGLADILADTYRLIFKTHGYHWNVTGPLFYSVHKLTETQYEDMFAATDEIAERIRALGLMAPMRFAELSERSVISDVAATPSAGEMVRDLVHDHERMAHRLNALIELASKRRDGPTADLATRRSAFHEQAAWMLRATAENGA
jgi:starvation-inducible DNA-binding protein